MFLSHVNISTLVPYSKIEHWIRETSHESWLLILQHPRKKLYTFLVGYFGFHVKYRGRKKNWVLLKSANTPCSSLSIQKSFLIFDTWVQFTISACTSLIRRSKKKSSFTWSKAGVAGILSDAHLLDQQRVIRSISNLPSSYVILISTSSHHHLSGTSVMILLLANKLRADQPYLMRNNQSWSTSS